MNPDKRQERLMKIAGYSFGGSTWSPNTLRLHCWVCRVRPKDTHGLTLRGFPGHTRWHEHVDLCDKCYWEWKRLNKNFEVAKELMAE